LDIIGPEQLVFGVEDLDESLKFATDFGLIKAEGVASGGVWESADGTSMKILRASDIGLARPNAPSPNIREAIYGVRNAATLQAIGAELSKDREVTMDAEGTIHSRDDDDYAIGFRIANRRPTGLPHYGVNVPGQEPGRGVNIIAARDEDRCQPLTLSHLVLFVHDKHKAEKFYTERLGFVTVDVFTNLGPFMRPAGTHEHHTLFLVEVPFRGVEHFAFHVAGANELLKSGWELTQKKGYTSPWGPGRHILGSNYFWYFNSPFGGKWEIDADMDIHDDHWVPRRMASVAETSQIFHFKSYRKYHPTEDLPHLTSK
jgi:catechol 2,3-dioxygenase-like lactoylglutathione lyase family enzyme